MSALDDMIAQQQAAQTQQERAALTPPTSRPFQEPAEKPAPQPPAPEGQQPGFLQRTLQSASDAINNLTSGNTELKEAATAGAAILRAPGQLIGGLNDTASDAGKFIDHNIQSPFVRNLVKGGLSGALTGGASPTAIQQAQAARGSGGASLADTLSARETLGKVGYQGANEFGTQAAAVVGALAIPGGGEEAAGSAAVPIVSRVLAGAGKLLTSSAKVGAAVAITSDPRSQRISDMIQQAGLHSAFIDYLASNPNDTDLEARFKNGIEGALGNAVADPIVRGSVGLLGKAMKAAMGGDAAGVAAVAGKLPPAPNATTISEATPEEAAADHLDRAFATGRTQEARYQAQEADLAATKATDSSEAPAVPAGDSDEVSPPPKQESLDAGTRHTDVPAAANDPRPLSRAEQLPDNRFVVFDTREAKGIAGIFPSEDQAKAFIAASPDKATLDYGSQRDIEKWNPTGEDSPDYQDFSLRQRIKEALRDRTTLATDANQALDKAGSSETLNPDTMRVTPKGKIVVSPSSLAAANDAGLGRAFDTAEGLNEPEHVIFKEEDGQGGSRVVGMMGKDDLEGFVQEAQHYLDHPEEPSVGQINEGTAPETAGRVGQWSIGKLGASYDVPAFMRALADRIGGSVRPLSDGELNAQARIIANQTGLHPDDIFDLGAQVAGSTKDLAVGMQAIRTVQARVLGDLMDLRGIDFSTAEEDSPLIQDAITKVHNAATFASYVEEAKTNVGQGLRVMGLPDADAYAENVAGQARATKPLQPRTPEQIPLPRNRQELQDWMDRWDAISTTGSPEAVQAYLKGLISLPGKWAYLGTSVANLFVGALVSAPRTLIRDLWGPAIISGFNTVGRMGAGSMLALNPALGAAARQEAWVASWGAARAYATTLSDTLDALRSAAKTVGGGFTRGAASADPFWDPFGSNLGNTHTRLGGGNPIDMNSQGVPRTLLAAQKQQWALTGAAQGTSGAGVTGAFPYWAGNLLNKFPQAVMSIHGGFNDFAQTLAYLGEVRASAYQEAGKLGLEGDDFKQYLTTRLTTARDPNSGAALDPDAFNQAQRTTLTRQPDETDPKAMQAAFKLRQQLAKDFPPTRFVLPIFTVPANALGESLRRIPGLGFAFQQSGEELTGQHGVAAMVDAYGRMMTGAGVLTAGAMLGQSGALTGAGPTSQADREAWEGRSGDGSVMHQPYSIKVGDHWYSYAKSDVVGPMLSIMAAFYDKTVYSGEDLGPHAMAAAAGLAEYFKDQASLQGLAQVLNFGGNPQESQSIMTRVLGQIGSGFEPGFLHQIRDNLDPFQRVHHTIGDYIIDGIPGLSKSLDPVRNVLGEPVMKPQSPVFGTLPVSMSNLNTFAKDPVQDENARLFQVTGEAHGVMSPTLGPNTQADMRDVKLEDGSSLYDALMRYRMVSKNDDGQTLKEALSGLYSSEEYHEAVDGKSTALTTDDGENIRGSMARQVYDAFNKQTREDVANASPIAARYLAVAQAMNHNPTQLGGHSAHDLAGTPGLLSALGININDYEDKVRGQ